jgi:death on curing protein
MAAAYLFHVTSNHPFVDGNKRVGLLSALVFLELNGVSLTQGSEELYALTMAVAAGQRTKA